MLLELGPTQTFDSPPGASFEELRPLSPLMHAEQAGLLAYARALSIWRKRQRFCGVCGLRALPERAGHVIRGTNETEPHEFFPRIDPAIIVLVTDGEDMQTVALRLTTFPRISMHTIAALMVGRGGRCLVW